MTRTCLNELLTEHPGIVTLVIYFFELARKSKIYLLPIENSSLSFYNMLKIKCRLILPGVLYIDCVTNRCISNTLSALN